MIRAIIFDFGGIFINLDKLGSMQKFVDAAKIDSLSPEMTLNNQLYEQGLINSDEFVNFYANRLPHLSRKEIVELWNSILLDFPKSRLDFIKGLSAETNYKLILLSNTNDLHISWIKENVSFYGDFKAQFDAFYLSHEIRFRKPNADIYEFVLKQNNLVPEEAVFIDDTKENIDAAAKLGIKVWHLNENTEQITQLFQIKKELF